MKHGKIKGDSGQVFCNNGSANCTINDAGTSRLWIITKKSFINPSYYAPEFFENCCPQKERGLFSYSYRSNRKSSKQRGANKINKPKHY